MMVQWTGRRDRYPDERCKLTCPDHLIELLVRYDHHVVWLGGRPALLLTLHLRDASDEQQHTFEVSFTYPRGHPQAPAQVREAVAALFEGQESGAQGV